MTMKSIASKTLLALSLSMLLLAGCAGSKSGLSDGGGDGSSADGPAAKPTSAKELDKTAKEALALENENHELRREIFESKNKLGIAVEIEDEE